MPETSSAGLVALPNSAADSGRLPARRVLPRPDRREIAAIFAGGAAGTLARAVLSEAFPHPATAWPWPTYTVNVVAAFGTMQVEILKMLGAHAWGLAAGYAAAGIAAGYAVIHLATALVRRVRVRR